ncbi:hypothetical protein [Ferrimonas marina]|uniref:Uncharacterized protein n=1 Tax=Ferrimonas marina TaxID=299255 RepID=A0A1M5TRE8_9GAMM|nr:hypothetical protein [Ferrimonas marina]SHH53176.1 hypothetical protein SAMN02745129_2244 [Ferrimonas marina]
MSNDDTIGNYAASSNLRRTQERRQRLFVSRLHTINAVRALIKLSTTYPAAGRLLLALDQPGAPLPCIEQLANLDDEGFLAALVLLRGMRIHKERPGQLHADFPDALAALNHASNNHNP